MFIESLSFPFITVLLLEVKPVCFVSVPLAYSNRHGRREWKHRKLIKMLVYLDGECAFESDFLFTKYDPWVLRIATLLKNTTSLLIIRHSYIYSVNLLPKCTIYIEILWMTCRWYSNLNGKKYFLKKNISLVYLFSIMIIFNWLLINFYNYSHLLQL